MLSFPFRDGMSIEIESNSNSDPKFIDLQTRKGLVNQKLCLCTKPPARSGSRRGPLGAAGIAPERRGTAVGPSRTDPQGHWSTSGRPELDQHGLNIHEQLFSTMSSWDSGPATGLSEPLAGSQPHVDLSSTRPLWWPWTWMTLWMSISKTTCLTSSVRRWAI